MEARTLMKLIGWPVLLVHCTDWPVCVSWTYAWPSASPWGESYSLVGAEVSDTTLAPPPSAPSGASYVVKGVVAPATLGLGVPGD